MWARVVNGKVHEITDIDPTDRFVPAIVEQFFPCDEQVKPNWLYNGTAFHAPGPQTPEEIEAAAWAGLRAKRDSLLKDPALTDRLERYRNQRDGGFQTTDTPEWFAAALAYLQALRDLPETAADPANPDWPAPPA